MEALSAEVFEKAAAEGGIIIDTRSTDVLKKGFIKGSIAISSFSVFRDISSFLNPGVGAVLLVGAGTEDEALLQDQWADAAGNRIKGYLKGGFESWKPTGDNIDMIVDVEADELIMDIPFDENLVVVDIRPAIVYGSGHLKDAVNLPLNALTDPLRLAAIEEKDNLYIVGGSDEESFLAASLLKKQEIHNLRVVTGGWEAIEAEKKAEIVKEPGILN